MAIVNESRNYFRDREVCVTPSTPVTTIAITHDA